MHEYLRKFCDQQGQILYISYFSPDILNCNTFEWYNMEEILVADYCVNKEDSNISLLWAEENICIVLAYFPSHSHTSLFATVVSLQTFCAQNYSSCSHRSAPSRLVHLWASWLCQINWIKTWRWKSSEFTRVEESKLGDSLPAQLGHSQETEDWVKWHPWQCEW